MRQDLEKELEKIGLTDKEAKVYLAGLELGAATAQQLAAKATVQRASTYVAIESLIKRGLMSSFHKGKKRFFRASHPGQLTYLVESKRRQLDKEMDRIKSVISSISPLIGDVDEKMTVELIEGPESIAQIQGIMQRSEARELRELVRIEEARKYIPARDPRNPNDIRNRLVNQYDEIKVLMCQQEKPDNLGRDKNIERRYLSPAKFDLKAEIHVFGENVVLAHFGSTPQAIHIRGRFVADAVCIMFDGLWEQAIQ